MVGSFSHKQRKWVAFANLTQQVTWSWWKNSWFQELTHSWKGEVSFTHLFLLSLSYITWSRLLWTEKVLLPLHHSSSMPDAQLNEFGRSGHEHVAMVSAQAGQPPHSIASFCKCKQKLLTSLPPLSITTSLTSKGLGLPKNFNSQSSKYFSLEETQYFLQNHPA